jgi:hypothetical protein
MSDKILILNDFVPDDICRKMCELVDESEENKGERNFIRGKNLNAMELDAKKQMSTRLGKQWQEKIIQFKKAVELGYKKWLDKTGEKPAKQVYLEVPKIHRYDVKFGKHISTIYKKNRIVTCFFYLNDVDGSVLQITDTKNNSTFKIPTKKGMCVIFPASKDFEYDDNCGKQYLKYALKTHYCEKN